MVVSGPVTLGHGCFGTSHFGTWLFRDQSLWDMVVSGPVTLGHGCFGTSHFGTWLFRDQSVRDMVVSGPVTLGHGCFGTSQFGTWLFRDPSVWDITRSVRYMSSVSAAVVKFARIVLRVSQQCAVEQFGVLLINLTPSGRHSLFSLSLAALYKRLRVLPSYC